MSKATLNLIYDGDGIADHTMDVRDLAPALLAFGDLIDEANKILGSSRNKTTTRVRGSFKTGSFGVDLQIAQNIIERTLGIMGDLTAEDIIHYLGFSATITGIGLLQLIKWINGRRIKKEIIEGDNVTIIIDEDHITVERKVMQLFHNRRIRDSIEDIIAKPLSKDGVDKFAITSDPNKGFVVVESDEAGLFMSPIVEDECINENTVNTTLIFKDIKFSPTNKWRFSTSDGIAFYANILDEPFKDNVLKSRIRFGANDTLDVSLRIRELRDGDAVKTEHDIIEVLRHNIATEIQIEMDF